jgi:hypothetical protein
MTQPNETTSSRPSEFNFDSKTPAELESHRRKLVDEIRTYPGGAEEAPISLLRELAYLTATLRRRNAGPPARAKTTEARTKKKTGEQLLDLI